MNVRIKLLGIPHIRVEAEDVKLPNRRVTLSLLAYLVLHRGETLARSHVAFAIWPDEEEERALSELRRYLYKLRRLLPEEGSPEPFLIVDDDTIAFSATAPCELDIVEFERLARDPARAAEAIALYDGDLLEEIYDDWVLGERERLRGIFLATLWSSIVAHRSRRAFPEAVALTQRLLAADPWREDAVRQLMALRYESGDAAGALATYDRFARALRAEMNVEPMPETVAVREAILRGGTVASKPPVASGAPAEPPVKASDPLALPFVGRAREFDALHERWLEAGRGRGSLAVVVGEAGIGKSRLTGELALAADSSGGRVLVGTTTSPEYRPYQALVDALRGALPLVAAVDLAKPALAALAELLPDLRERRPELPRLEHLEPQAERSRLFDAIAQVLVALARPRPVLLLLEDLHWAGSVTFDALAYLAPRIANAAVAIVATVREEQAKGAHPLRDLERSLRGSATFTRVALGPLDRASVRALVASAMPAGDEAGAVSDALFERSEGNALFATEMLRDAASGGRDRLAIPNSIRAMIDERAAQLAAPARAFADVAAVVGFAFDLDLVCDVGGITLRDAESALDELLERHVVTELTRRSRNDYAFTHQLVHAALYDAVADDARERRHRRVARVLDAQAESGAREREESAAEIAFHYDRGGEALAAARAYLRAARRADAIFANAEARAWAQRGIELAAADDALRFDLLRAHCEIVSRVGDRAAHAEDVAAMRELAPALGVDAQCAALERALDLAVRSDDRAGELAAIEELERVAHAAEHARWSALAVAARSQRELAMMRGAAGLERALEAIAMFEALGDDEGVIDASLLAATASADIGDGAGALALARGARERAERRGSARQRMNALRMEARAAQACQDGRYFASVALAALALTRATGDRDAEAHAHYQLGSAYWSLWRVDDGLAHLRSACALFESLGSSRVSTARNNLAGFLLDLGVFEEAERVLKLAFDVASRAAHHDTANHAACNLAELAWMRGDALGARQAAQRAFEAYKHLPSARHETVARIALARALRCEGDFAGAVAEYDRVIAAWAAIDRYVDLVDALYEAAPARYAAGDVAGARAAFERIAAIVAERPEVASQYPARAFWSEACVRRAAGDDGWRAALAAATKALDERTAAIGDAKLRAAFAAIPYHLAVVAARDRDLWPSLDRCVVAFATELRTTAQPI